MRADKVANSIWRPELLSGWAAMMKTVVRSLSLYLGTMSCDRRVEVPYLKACMMCRQGRIEVRCRPSSRTAGLHAGWASGGGNLYNELGEWGDDQNA